MKNSLLAGVFISIAGFAYLSVGGVLGAFLFAFGLSSIILYKFDLFTGKAGYLPFSDTKKLFFILLGNLIGCIMTSVCLTVSYDIVSQSLSNIISVRENSDLIKIFVLSVATGVIMETAVGSLRNNDKSILNILPLILGIPTFILCGMPHCIADAFYYSFYIITNDFESWILLKWMISVLGNYIGCNIMRKSN